MALRPDTPETRMVPVAGRQFAERRLIRGVGAKERAVGYAWGRMTSAGRAHYGNQRNFAHSMQEAANRRAMNDEEVRDEQLRNQGRQRAVNDFTTPEDATPLKKYPMAPANQAVNHAKAVMDTPLSRKLKAARLRGPVRMSESGSDY